MGRGAPDAQGAGGRAGAAVGARPTVEVDSGLGDCVPSSVMLVAWLRAPPGAPVLGGRTMSRGVQLR